MVAMDLFASAFGFDAKSDDVWTALGKVTAVNGNTLSVMLGGSATPMECDAYCHADVGDVVFVVIEKGKARAVSRRGGDSANALINALGSGTGSITLDDTLIITQNSNATEQKYYRRPVSKLWSYIKSKIDSTYGIGSRESIEQSTNVTLTSSTGKKVTSLTLDPGTWIIVGHLSFSSNASGHRAGCITTTENTVGTSSAYCGSFRIATTGGSYTTVGNCTTIVTISVSMTYYLNAWQNSGGDLNATGCMRAIRIA